MVSFLKRHKKLRYLLIIIGELILLLSPAIYLAFYSPTEFGEETDCQIETSERFNVRYSKTSLKEIALAPEEWEGRGVSTRAKISFAPLSEQYYLSDNEWSMPVDASGCKNMEIFNDGAALVAVYGTINIEDGEPIFIINDFFETVPPAARIVFNAGVYGLFGLAVLPIALFIKKRRIKNGWDPESEKERKRQAFGPLFFGIMGTIAWFANPLIGAFALIFGLIIGKKFLRSPARKIVIIGMVFCVVMIVGLGLFTASGKFDFRYGTDFFTAVEDYIGRAGNE